MRNSLASSFFALAISGVLGAWPLAVEAGDAGLTVEQAWSRPAALGQMGVMYFTVKDSGAPDRLIGVRTTVADGAQLHESIMDGNVMKMRPVAASAVAPGKPLVLAPGGLHVMLMGLKEPLKEGGSIPVTLLFEKAGEIAAKASVRRSPPRP